MAKVVQFPAGRSPRTTVQARVLAPFVEQELLERAEGRLLAACAGAALLLTLALQFFTR